MTLAAVVRDADPVRRDAVVRRRTAPAGARRPTVAGDRQPGAGRRGERGRGARRRRRRPHGDAARRLARPANPAGVDQGDGVGPARSDRRVDPRPDRRGTAHRRRGDRPPQRCSSGTCSMPAGCRSARWRSTCSRPRSPTSSPLRCTARTCPNERVRVDIPSDLAAVSCDTALLERSLANIITNAERFSPLDQPVRIEAASIGHDVHLRVVDRGTGIAADDRGRVVQPFQRLGDVAGRRRGRDWGCRSPMDS